MSVYIKGMEMPKDCPMCPLAYWDFTGEFRGCNAVNGKKYAMETEPGYPETNFRPSWCPLVPVPAHGGLVDLKAPFCAQYYDEMTEEWIEKEVTVEDVLLDSMVYDMPPVVIPADKEAEE